MHLQAHTLGDSRNEVDIKPGGLAGTGIDILLRGIGGIAANGQRAGSEQVIGGRDGWRLWIGRRGIPAAARCSTVATGGYQHSQHEQHPAK